MSTQCAATTQIEQRLLARNPLFANFFAREATHLSEACREMSDRFLRGGRLLAFGRGPYATDAQHVAVEFVHPVIVGKRALPALDLSTMFVPWLDALVTKDDIVMGFGPPEGDAEVQACLQPARRRGAMTFALPGVDASYAVDTHCSDPFMHQELIEILYHTLWETVHVFFERRELGHDVGQASFLYPFLGAQTETASDSVMDEVARSIQMKAADDATLRKQVAHEQADGIASASAAIAERVNRGGKLIIFGNGGSATDANDFAIDCVAPPFGYKPIPAVSLSLEPANITAIANDVGAELIFLRQLIAQARADDVAVAISTSGGSRNILAALEEARKRKMTIVALLGYDGGEIVRRSLADFPIVVRSDYIPRIQEVQASVYHVIRETLEAFGHA
jgi:D-sedoheptulose 7-phosphate isomerase